MITASGSPLGGGRRVRVLGTQVPPLSLSLAHSISLSRLLLLFWVFVLVFCLVSTVHHISEKNLSISVDTVEFFILHLCTQYICHCHPIVSYFPSFSFDLSLFSKFFALFGLERRLLVNNFIIPMCDGLVVTFVNIINLKLLG